MSALNRFLRKSNKVDATNINQLCFYAYYFFLSLGKDFVFLRIFTLIKAEVGLFHHGYELVIIHKQIWRRRNILHNAIYISFFHGLSFRHWIYIC